MEEQGLGHLFITTMCFHFFNKIDFLQYSRMGKLLDNFEKRWKFFTKLSIWVKLDVLNTWDIYPSSY